MISTISSRNKLFEILDIISVPFVNFEFYAMNGEEVELFCTDQI